ncbi:MAG TPA: O-antigen ligase family protein [Patescibacteria group bacterium]|nr:O-antigen ligase family protein [Patescibacteria group bacterium]
MKAIRIGIPLLVTFAVLAYGAVQPWSEAVLEIGAALLLAIWVLTAAAGREIEVRWNALFVPLGGLVALALVQWASGTTVYAYVTEVATLQLAAGWIFLFLTIQAFRTPREWKNLVWFLMGLAFAVSVFAIIQSFTWNGKIYWLQTLHNGGRYFGPFVNRNDFAGFVELILPLGLSLLLFDGERQERRLLVGLFVVFPAAALLISASRAGVVSFLIEVFLLGILSGMYGRRSRRWLLAGIALAIIALAAWLGIGYTVERFVQKNSTEVSVVNRLEIVRNTWHLFLSRPLLGTGMGTFETAYPRYQTHYVGLIVNHAHNDYIELLSDGGIVAALLGLAFLGILYRNGLRNLRRARTALTRSLYAGGLVACTGLLAHELVDFNLHIPSNGTLFLVLAALATAVIPEPIANARYRRFSAHLPS